MGDYSKRISGMSPVKLAFAAKQLGPKLGIVTAEPIAIVGMGCRFPGNVNTPDEFWDLLCKGENPLTKVPKDRWNIDNIYDSEPGKSGKMYTQYGSFLNQIDQFDASFFGISPREAVMMDPQQRLLLETVWESLENAGIDPESLRGTQTGVFLGVMFNDYSRLTTIPLEVIDMHTATGYVLSIAAGRLSYFLGLQGPAMTIDTACSSSLVCLHLACHSLRMKECDLALTCGVNIILEPFVSVSESSARMLSKDGRCKAFDASADGYGRGEGCGSIVLKRLSDAIADNDNIIAIVRGSAVNHDGRSSGLTAPSAPSQEKVIRQALKNSGVDASQVGYIEAHGTGTSLGDPIEIDALSAVFGERTKQNPLLISSVKTNIGHTEGAAGIASLIKAVLCLQNKSIPPHLHFKNPNPYIEWDKLPIKIPVEQTDWNAFQGRRIAGLNSFGLSGTNVHVLLEQWAEDVSTDSSNNVNFPFYLFNVSAKDYNALEQLIDQYETRVFKDLNCNINDLCCTVNRGRAHFDHRLSIIGSSLDDIYKKLIGFKNSKNNPDVVYGHIKDKQSKKVAFLFTGQGSQYFNMGKELYETQPVFKKYIDKCNEILLDYLDKPLIEILYQNDSGILDQTAYTQPALFSIEYALSKLWESWGIKPSAVMGHSVGEYTAACVAGILTLEDGLKLIATRGKLMQSLPQNGQMAAVFADEERVTSYIKKFNISIAAMNGAHIVISGDDENMQAVMSDFEQDGIKSKRLNVSHAFHSYLMEPILDEFEQKAAQVTYHPMQIDLISNISGKLSGNEILTSEYWKTHIIKPVKFSLSIQTLLNQGYDYFVEIGPKPVLLGMARLFAPENSSVWLPSLRQGVSDWYQMLNTLGNLYTTGFNINWKEFYKPYKSKKLCLPTYPFQRKRYWVDNSGVSDSQKTRIEINSFPGNKINLPFSNEIRFESLFDTSFAPLDDHRLFEISSIPAAFYISLMLSAASIEFGFDLCVLKDLTFPNAFVLDPDEKAFLQIVLNRENEKSIQAKVIGTNDKDNQNEADSWKVYSQGIVENNLKNSKLSEIADDILLRCKDKLESENFYSDFSEAGYTLGTSFKWLGTIFKGSDESISLISIPDTALDFNAYKLYPGIIDSCLHLLTTCAEEGLSDMIENNYIYIPFIIEEFLFYKKPDLNQKLWCYAKATYKDKNSIKGDILLFDESSEPVFKILGFNVRKADKNILLQGLKKTKFDDLLYKTTWIPKPVEEKSKQPCNWLIFADQDISSSLIANIKENGEKLVYVGYGDEYIKTGANYFSINPNNKEDFTNLLNDCENRNDITDVVYLWGLDQKTEGDFISLFALVSLVQSLAIIGMSCRLWIVTQDAQYVKKEDSLDSVFQSCLWGFGLIASIEHPDLKPMRVDLPAKGDVASMLCNALFYSDDEDQIAFRDDLRYVSRLVKADNIKEKTDFKFKKDATYIITGGFGALGLGLALWMNENGAKNIVLTSRSASKSSPIIEQLSQKGANVFVAKADVSKKEDVDNLFEQISQNMPKIKGIIHAAGVLDDGVIMQQTRNRFEKVMSPKVAGAWNIHKAAQDIDLDFFVLFSSAASMIGSAGQSNYASANAFMDALAYYRKTKGLPGLSINWGPWSYGGMADNLNKSDQERWQSQGITVISPDQGMQAFNDLLIQDYAQAGVFQIDWNKFAKFLRSVPKLFSDLSDIKKQKTDLSVSKDIKTSDFTNNLSKMSFNDAKEALIKELESGVIKVLRLDQDHVLNINQSLFDIGMDSLTALEFKNHLQTSLGQSLPATLIFDYPSIEKLGKYFQEKLLQNVIKDPEQEPEDMEKQMPQESEDIEQELEQMSEQELEQLLLEKMAKLENE